MSNVIVTYCGCGPQHEPDCIIPIMHRVKERICNERGIASYIPEVVAKIIDIEVVKEHKRVRKIWAKAKKEIENGKDN